MSGKFYNFYTTLVYIYLYIFFDETTLCPIFGSTLWPLVVPFYLEGTFQIYVTIKLNNQFIA